MYREFVHLLWESSALGVTVFRGEEGVDRDAHIQSADAAYLSQSLPITMHIVFEDEDATDEFINRVCAYLNKSNYLLFASDAKWLDPG
ncbi:MAG: DUF190 domain-containing protein [Alicyclobacillus shizuokensis]|nr:DUF190 domain-containing protein [Alicyclobacillus shizuokensis]